MLPTNIVHNIRYGLATNSSSSHSIIHNANLDKNSSENTNEFGWDFFTLSSQEDKKQYMLMQLLTNMDSSRDPFEFIMDKLNIDTQGLFGGYVDHESLMHLPKGTYGNSINMKFFSAYYDYILDNDFIILGGNDNDDYDHDLANESDEAPNYMYEFSKSDRVYKNGNYWVLIDPSRKMRISFDQSTPVAEVPELIDLKITDYCDMGCEFCYQGSTTDGMHANYDYISSIIDKSSYQVITEFAIGGGEPTSHPDFNRIINKIHKTSNIANFTTKTTIWMNDHELTNTVKECVSGIAYSPDTVNRAKQFINDHDQCIGKQVAIYLHIIPNLWTKANLIRLQETIDYLNSYACHERNMLGKISITFLGYKTTERGGTYQNRRGMHPDFIDYIQTFTNTQIGIDTKLVNDYAAELSQTSIDSRLFTAQEGEYSMYIDAVTQKAYKSSYELDTPIDTVQRVRHYGDDNQHTNYTLFSHKDIFKQINTKAT